MYTGWQVCATLDAKHKCLRLRQYSEGRYEDLHHEHIPANRLNADDAIELMKALVLRFENASAAQIVEGYLNLRRGKSKARDFRIAVEYPEKGVLRKYCGTNVQAWIDDVISPASFRQPGK